MTRTLRAVLLILALLVAVVACGDDNATDKETTTERTDGETTGERIDIAEDEALTWGKGDYGVVLAHGAAFDAASWEDQATAIADQGATVVAVENIDPAAIEAAVDYLREQGQDEVALVGGSAGADGILQLLSDKPETADLVITLAANATVEGLGDQPKLFIAAEDDPVSDISTTLAETAPGGDNEALILGGSAHAQNIFDSEQGPEALQAILDRLAR